MVGPKSEVLPLVREQDVVLARQAIRSAARQLSFTIVDQTKLVTAASELARNAVVHGGGGTVVWETVAENGRQGLRLTFNDNGLGIEDTRLAMKMVGRPAPGWAWACRARNDWSMNSNSSPNPGSGPP
jgi:serine/threonine-protein kinase RsbT